jgi:Tfp pilus assembly protein PilV
MIKIIKNFNTVISAKQLSLGGFSLIELLVSVSIFLIFVISITGVTTSVSTTTRNSANKERAVILAEEALEASRNIRDAGFANLIDGTYGLSTAGNEWSLSGSSDLTDIFTRVLNISTISENQKRVDVTITWADIISPTNSMTMSTYLTNWREILNIDVGLTVNKTVINHGGSKVASDFAPYKVTGTVLAGDPPVPTVVETPITIGESILLGVGTYTVSETTDPDYMQTFSGDCNASGVVNLIANSVNTCVITNEEKSSQLIVNKNVINHFGSKVVSDFTLLVDSNPVVSGETNIFNSGSHTVSEVNDPLYDLTIGGDCDGSGVVNLSPGITKTCTLTNEEIIINCTGTPWGTMASGTSDTAYLASSPAGACIPETRICTNGVLSGSYTATSCIAGCAGTPWGDVSTGYSDTAYQSSNVTYPSVCVSETRTCTAGTMSGSYTSTSCIVTNIAPTVTTTSPVTSITQASAIGGGNVTSNGGSTVTVSGLVWSTSLNPTTLDSKTTDGWALGGPWTSTMTGLTCGNDYYVRAYATNSIGTSYGSNVSFTTGACNTIPTVTTPTNTSVTSTSATLGANVTSLGIPASISARGICYGTTSSPTNCVSEGGTTTGVFTQSVTGLTPGTLY